VRFGDNELLVNSKATIKQNHVQNKERITQVRPKTRLSHMSLQKAVCFISIPVLVYHYAVVKIEY